MAARPLASSPFSTLRLSARRSFWWVSSAALASAASRCSVAGFGAAWAWALALLAARERAAGSPAGTATATVFLSALSAFSVLSALSAAGLADVAATFLPLPASALAVGAL